MMRPATPALPRSWHIVWTLAIVGVAVGLRIMLAPTTGFMRCHMTDLAGGLVLPSIGAMFTDPAHAWGRWVRSFTGTMMLTLGGIIGWEILVPLVSATSTPDPIDALCYLVGGLVQHLAVITARRHRDGGATMAAAT